MRKNDRSVSPKTPRMKKTEISQTKGRIRSQSTTPKRHASNSKSLRHSPRLSITKSDDSFGDSLQSLDRRASEPKPKPLLNCNRKHGIKAIDKFNFKNTKQIIWQAKWLMYSKKKECLFGVSPCMNAKMPPTLLKFSIDDDIRKFSMTHKNSQQPCFFARKIDNEIPHLLIFHKQTKTWMCSLDVLQSGDNCDIGLYFCFANDKTIFFINKSQWSDKKKMQKKEKSQK